MPSFLLESYACPTLVEAEAKQASGETATRVARPGSSRFVGGVAGAFAAELWTVDASGSPGGPNQ